MRECEIERVESKKMWEGIVVTTKTFLILNMSNTALLETIQGSSGENTSNLSKKTLQI